MNTRNKHSITLKVIIILILFILPLNFLSLGLGNIMIKNTLTSTSTSISFALDSSMNDLDKIIENTNYFLYSYPKNNTDCIHYLQTYEDWHYTFYRSSTATSLINDLSLSNAADSMFFFIPSRNDFMLVKNSRYSQDPANILSKYSEEILDHILTPDISDGKWHFIEYKNAPYLFRITQIEQNYFGAFIYLGKIVTALEDSLKYNNIELSMSDSTVDTNSKMLHYYSKSSLTELYLNCDIPEKEIIGNITFWQRCAYFLLVLFFLLVPALYILFYREIVRPLNVIKTAYHELEKGNEKYRITAPAPSSEFLENYTSFNKMAENLSILRSEAITKEQQKQQLKIDNLTLQLNNLQLQIRPHFLQNMMNLLYALIQNNQNEPAQNTVLYISNYFRYMFRNGHELELFDKELNLIKEYLKVSLLHYPNAFTVSYQIDPILSFVRIPPLLLHNFVENIIQYAFIPNQTIHIILYGEYNDGLVTIQIADDGRGMAEEIVKKINNNDFSLLAPGKHIGIRNSISRLKHYYGKTASVTVDSAPGSGTTFTIIIPYNLSEEDTL
ncbi:sensor histidine kinase [Mediterraneibacter massiliensis]|uniref:sensor histidine kinase n=1 Tax=Mediterraneibacter massiliensis TaxID=1720300 RepID=UPI0024ADB74E|nr:histidine kinase [Mediterraneibacter massiliensis]